MNKLSTKYYFANWKMFQSLSLIKSFLRDCKKDNNFLHEVSKNYIGIAASYEHLYFLHTKLKKIRLHLGAQDCSVFRQGAYTGQTSVESLSEMDVSFCLIGHSEVREYLGQTDDLIASKFALLLAANISPILCIGDSFDQYKNKLTLQVLYDQLENVIQFLQSYHGATKIFIAYEPVYAIGSGIIPEEHDLEQIFYFLKNLVKELPVAKNVIFLYGGSVSIKTIPQLECIEGIGGFLIGKASIDFQELKKIVQSNRAKV